MVEPNLVHQVCLTRLVPLYLGSCTLRCPKCKCVVATTGRRVK